MRRLPVLHCVLAGTGMGFVAGLMNAITLAYEKPDRTLLDGLALTLFGTVFGMTAMGVGGPVLNRVADWINFPLVSSDGPEADYRPPGKPPPTGP